MAVLAIAQHLPEDTELLQAEYTAVLRAYHEAVARYRETAAGDASDPRVVLRHDMACAQLQAAEANLQALLHDARALGVPLVPVLEESDDREPLWKKLAGWAAWGVISWALIGVVVLNGRAQWAALGVVTLMGAAVWGLEVVRQ